MRPMLFVVVASMLAFAAPRTAQAQAVDANGDHAGGMLHPVGERPSFEVASIRPSSPGAEVRFNGIGMPRGHFEATGTTVRDLILFAYAVPDERELSGGPGWMRTDRYDLLAKPAPAEVRALDALPSTRLHDQYRLRLQKLLEERFQLQVGFVQKQLPLLVLELAKGGFKCKRTAPSNVAVYDSPAGLPPPPPPPAVRHVPGAGREGERDEIQYTSPGLPFPLILAWISAQPEVGGRTVVDRTGLDGGFACEMTFTRDPTNAADSSFFTALREQMGLRLRPERGSVETLVVQRIERPSAN